MTPIKYAKQELAQGRFPTIHIEEIAGGFYFCDREWKMISGSKNYTSKDAAIKDRSKILDRAHK